jgi:transcriptional regulator with XRE-family HTH domain
LGKYAESENLIELGNRIRRRRMELHLSQETVAEKADISTNTVSRIEGGQTAMSIEIFIKLVGVLDADANELLGGIVFTVGKGGRFQDMFYHINHLKACNQAVVLKTMETLVEELRRCG